MFVINVFFDERQASMLIFLLIACLTSLKLDEASPAEAPVNCPAWLKGRTVMLVRHGNTGAAETDAERPISDLGVQQCNLFRSKYGNKLARVKSAFSSPVTRTTKTASLLGFHDVKPIADLYFGSFITPEMEAVDEKLGYRPLRDYLENHSAVYAPARSAIVRVLEEIGSAVTSEGDILIVGHATYLSLLALEMCQLGFHSETSACAAKQLIKDTNVGEVEGFEISAAGVRFLNNVIRSLPDSRNSDDGDSSLTLLEMAAQ